MNKISVNILILERDLRILDNPALEDCFSEDFPFLIVFYDSCNPRKPSEISFLWFLESLKKFKENLGKNIEIFYCLREKGLKNFFDFLFNKDVNVNKIFSNIDIDFLKTNLNFCKHNPNLLLDSKKLNREFKIFTPFYKHCMSEFFSGNTKFFYEISNNHSIQSKISINFSQEFLDFQKELKKGIENLSLKNYKTLDNFFASFDEVEFENFPKWWLKIKKYWEFGESAALKKFEDFYEKNINSYKSNRDFLSFEDSFCKDLLCGKTSKLSPHIHFGEISVRFIFQKIIKQSLKNVEIETFLKQIFWREFANSTLFYHNDLHKSELRIDFFKNFSWLDGDKFVQNFEKWKLGQTGFPIIDAAMRQLFETGWMHNRTRMVVASFLTKNLLIDWRHGESWFFETLVDGDSAINPFSWQWVAGCGTDSSPYFRIFNPILQSQKFDPKGEYIKKFVPELSKVEPSKIHDPWNFFQNIESFYYKPIVDLSLSRQIALNEFSKIKSREVSFINFNNQKD